MTARGHYDIVDVARHLLVSHPGVRWGDALYDTPRRRLHTIVVDEVQDLLPIQLMLLTKVSRHEPEKSGVKPTQFTFCGDTAQAVVKHSEFRFQTVKDLFHNQLKTFVPRDKSGKPVPPHDFQLTRNYRSASEILNLGNSCVDVMDNFFPKQVDKLQHEIAQASTNLRPVVVQMDMNTVINNLLGAGVDLGGVTGTDGTSVHFGAEQCVLVRTQRERQHFATMIRY